MAVQIFTTVVNRPDFVEIQKKLFDKFLLDEYQFHVIDDSIDRDLELEFKYICQNNSIFYYKKPPKKSEMNPAQACAEAVQWTFDEIIKKKYNQDIVLFCDSDMFLVEEFSIKDYMEGEVIAGHYQTRDHVYYMWNGIMFFDMKKIMEVDSDLDFSDGYVENILTDVGGNLYYYFERNKDKFKMKYVNDNFNYHPEYPLEYNGIDLCDKNLIWSGELKENIQFELHLDGKFLHYRAASNWFSRTWRSSNDPLLNKTEIFNKIIGEILND